VIFIFKPYILKKVQAAYDFLNLFYTETKNLDGLPKRRAEVQAEIAATGSYTQTFEELEFGARVAWRNSSRCIGRLYWKSLKVIDCRHLNTPETIKNAILNHLKLSTNSGAIKPMISIFPQQLPNKNTFYIENSQLIGYAGYRQEDGSILGDPAKVDFTDYALANGWQKTNRTAFDILPIFIKMPDKSVFWFELPPDVTLEVPIEHPDFKWLAELNLKWYALPAIADMILEIGGINYIAAPFSGWYMGTEIGARDLADRNRYNQLPTIAKKMGLDTTKKRTLWKDKALVMLNEAVLYSYEQRGVRIIDHHTAAEHFMVFQKQEAEAKRQCPADWTWIVPPMSSALTPVFHTVMENLDMRPNFLYRNF
jgi:nitric-oxide synthase, bacterial